MGTPFASPPPPASAAALRRQLERCWRRECDIDPLILRIRCLRREQALLAVRCLEQELLPLF